MKSISNSKKYYFNDVARSYDVDRKSSLIRRMKWRAEFLTLGKVLKSIPEGSSILDVPCGTGRFFPILQDRFRHFGCDISEDMLENIPESISKNARGLHVGEIGKLQFEDMQFDYLLCMRFINLFPPEQSFELLKDILRVAKQGVIIQIRFRGGLFNVILDGYRFLRKVKLKRQLEQSDITELQAQRELSDPTGGESVTILPERKAFDDFIYALGFTVKAEFPVVFPGDSQKIMLLCRK